jgi:hypothetical protein
MSSMLLRSMFTGAALAVLAAAPASASPVLDPLKPCYVAAQEEQREFVPIHVQAGGFTAFSPVDVFLDNIQLDPAQAAFDGSLTGTVQAPFPQSDQREFTLRLVQRDNPMNTVSATSLVTRLTVDQVPAKASTGERVRFKGRGFTNPAIPIYAHYVFAGKSVRTVRLGYPSGDCGLFSIKRKQFPFKKSPRVGVWTIQFDQELHYNPQATVRVPLTIKVKKTIRPRRAR